MSRSRFSAVFGSLLLATVAATGAVPAAAASTAGCDRACMKALADGLVASMVAHRPQDVPLKEYYRATDNGVPASLAFMELWRTISGAGARQYYIDTVAGQMFVIVSVAEGATHSLVWGRLKVEDRVFSELELYVTRSRGDAGFIFGDGTLEQLPAAWTRPIEPSRLPSREVLLRQGRAMFSPSIDLLPGSAECALIENGGVVREEDEWMKYNAPAGGPPPGAAPPPAGAAGGNGTPIGLPKSVTMTGSGCPLFPGRPADDKARVDVVDTEQGVAVSIASLEGLVYSYPVTNPTWSAFVPGALRGMHESTFNKAMATGKYRQPKVVTMPTAIFVGQLFRIYDGQIQGFHMVQKLAPTGSISPWTLPTVDAPGNGK